MDSEHTGRTASAPLPIEAALCSQTVGCTAVSLRLGFLATFHPITPSRKWSSLPYTGSLWPPFPPKRVASSVILHNLLGTRAEILLGSLPSSTPAWMMPTVLLPSPPPSPQSLSYPSLSFPGQSYSPALPPTSSLGLGGIYTNSFCNLLCPQIHPATSDLLWPLPLPFTFLL